jgi:dolichyl-phosphate beta-glucosyltransferase
MHLSVIVPAYNEEKRIEKTLISINNFLSKQNYNYEIIVVNDGSRDKTLEIVESLKLKIKNLEIINNKKNRGKGYAVRQGLLKAKGDYRLFTDADNSTPIEEVKNFLASLQKKYDIAIASRNMNGSIINNPQPFYRKFLGKIYSLLARLIVGLWEIKDTQCGFKLFRADVANNILPLCKINGWAFDSEILIIAKKSGYKIKEIPITWTNNLQTKLQLNGMMKMAFDLFKIRWHNL